MYFLIWRFMCVLCININKKCVSDKLALFKILCTGFLWFRNKGFIESKVFKFLYHVHFGQQQFKNIYIYSQKNYLSFNYESFVLLMLFN